jgi:hypothetical protein
MIAWMPDQPRMNKDPEFVAGKLRRVHDPHVQRLNALVDQWNGKRLWNGKLLRAPYADPDSGGIYATAVPRS